MVIRYRVGSSERRCAFQMHEILHGRHPLVDDLYTADDVAGSSPVRPPN